MRPARYPGFLGALTLLALAALAVLPSCGSDARAVDSCRKIEAARCERGPACIKDFVGDPDSCKRFYDVQCGRGVTEAFREPSTQELNDCLAAIRASCEVANDPTLSPACRFVNPNLEAGVTEAAIDAPEVATDGPGPETDTTTDSVPADTGPADTGPADTGPADTGPADTGPVDTGPADTGPADTMSG